jgi:hypothetical protein
MGSQYAPGFYDEHSLQAIEKAFHEVCEELARDQTWYGCDEPVSPISHRPAHIETC